MAARLRSASFAALLTLLVSFGSAAPADDAAPPGEPATKRKPLQERVAALKKELEKPRQPPAVAAPPAPAPAPPAETPAAGQQAPAPTPAIAEQPTEPVAAATPWITDFKI